MSESSESPGVTSGDASRGMKVKGFIILGIWVLLGVIFGLYHCNAEQEKRLLRNGALATAEITAITETGNVYNRQPEVEITLRVHPEDTSVAPYDATSTEVFDVLATQTYVVGARLWVRYDPDEPSEVAIAGMYEETATDDAPVE